MCNHYRKGQKVIEWSERRISGVSIPVALGEIAEHTYPKYPAPVTTEPNDFVARFHDRMPVVLDDAAAEAWLGDEPLPNERLLALCCGLPAEALLHAALPPKLKVTRPEKEKQPKSDEGPMLL